MDNGFTIGSREASPRLHKLYVYFDPTLGTGGAYRVATDATGAWPQVADEGAAQEQNGDGHFAMSPSITINITMPLAGSSNNGSGSGTRLK